MRADELIDRYLGRTPAARDAQIQDAAYSMRIKWLRTVLHLLDIALEDEGVPAETRVRVLRTALYGTVENPAEFQERIELQGAHLKNLRDPFS